MLDPKCIYRKSIFAKCTRLACLLSFASLFLFGGSRNISPCTSFLISSLKEEREANVATLNFLLPKVVQFQTLLTEKCLQFMPWSHPLAQITHRHAPDFSRNTKDVFQDNWSFYIFPGIKNWQRCFQVNCIFPFFPGCCNRFSDYLLQCRGKEVLCGEFLIQLLCFDKDCVVNILTQI